MISPDVSDVTSSVPSERKMESTGRRFEGQRAFGPSWASSVSIAPVGAPSAKGKRTTPYPTGTSLFHDP
eukprot:1010076-Pleurochrysis_carterae.AAC.2